MRGFTRLVLVVATCFTVVPATAFAQGAASIAGVVKDSSGAVLPGVTVEASSPALLEKTRTVLTNGTGQFKIVSLVPGVYTVTFSLQGFNTFKRDGIELTGSFVATVNADLKVGALAETITVTGETPLVDVQSATVQRVVTKEVIDAIPTGRLGINLAALTPGIILGAGGGAGVGNTNSLTSQDVGGTAGDNFTDLAIHGGKPSEQRQTIGGLSAATTIRFGESLSSSPSFTAMQEMAVDTSGADASLVGGGVRMNYIPRDGGNTFKGIVFYSGANNSMQATNYTTIADDPVRSLEARGLRTQPGALKKIYDFNPGYGGPVMKDRLWWFATARWTKVENYVAQNYPNKNFVVGVTPSTLLTPTTMTYSPDTSQPLRTAAAGGGDPNMEQTLRLSWQVSPKNKLGLYYNNKKRSSRNAVTTTSQEALTNAYFYPFSDQLAQWTAPLTNRLLLEAGFWHHQETWGSSIPPYDAVDPLAIGVTDNNPPTLGGYVQLINNYHGRVGTMYTPSHNPNYRSNFAASYVTGAHSFKTGIDLNGADRGAWAGSIVPYSLVVDTRATNGRGLGIPVANSISMRSDGCVDPLVREVNGRLVGGNRDPSVLCPTFLRANLSMEGGAYVQDKWTMDRVTLSLGVRLDWFNANQPEYHLGPSLLTPNRNYDVPYYDTIRQRDWTPKMAAAWDVFGDGKTAFKANFSKYVLGQALSQGLAVLSGTNIVLTASRTWVDNNGNFIPDCDLTSPDAQGPTAANRQVDTCGAVTGNSLNFFNTAPAPLKAADDDARYGWGKRPYSWEFSLSGQREIGRGVSVNGGYFRRWFGNFLVTDDVSRTANDYLRYSITPGLIGPAPVSSGGQELPSNTITDGFFGTTTAGAANNFVGLSDTFFPGSRVIDHWNGFDLGLNARLAHGVIFQGGVSTGRQTLDNCDIVDPANAGKFGDRSPLVEFLGNNPLSTCHVDQIWQTQVKFLGSYTVPKIDVQLGAAYQSIPGVEIGASYAEPNSDIARPTTQGGMGRVPATAVGTTTTLALIPPANLYGERLNQLDLRVGKVFRYGRTRSVVGIDFYNLFNVATVSSVSSTYTTWLAPQNIISPRLLKVSATFDF